MATNRLDDAFHELTSAQEGVAALRQARLLGFTDGEIRHRCASGRWETVMRGVVRVPGLPARWESDVMAGWLKVGDRAVGSRGAAAALLDLDGRPPFVLEFTAVRGRAAPVAGVTLHSTRTLTSADLTTFRRAVAPAVRRSRILRRVGLVTTYRLTTASRTIVDLAPQMSADELARMIDSAARAGHSSPAYLARRLEELRGPGRYGVGKVADAMTDAGGHSVLERTFLRAVRTAGLPRPRTQVTSTADRRFVARVDFDFHPVPLVVEVNGAKGHSSDADRAKDARRRNELQAMGLTVIEFTFWQVTRDPSGVARIVASHLTRLASPRF